MSAQNTKFLDSFKSKAKLLHMAFDVVVNTSNTPLKSPSHSQCLEIAARSLGFKTYKGLIESSESKYVYLTDFDRKKLLESYLYVNRKDEVIHIHVSEIISSVFILATAMEGYRFLPHFYLPKLHLAKHINFDNGPLQISNPSTKIYALWCVSLLIEKSDGYDVYKNEYEASRDKYEFIYDVPMSFFSQRTIGGWARSRDFLRDFSDLFQHCDFIHVQTGWTDFETFHNSRLNIYIPAALHENIIKLAHSLKA
ncbi:hypothetical protein A7M79_01005 [Acinetobacter baumannii]|uniref:hypothetical protein n=1 Tax=Acinetobacter baumannii TaxID=470 RepID=UPI0008DD4FE3|nr:hypothetical protein [Acinetobacter baumannii]OIH12096.1 hypothetical protein A7M79_01005 [Acinetobacter baumannii]